MAGTRQSRSRVSVLVVAAAVAAAASACNPAPVPIAARKLTPTPLTDVRRIAVAPFTTGELGERGTTGEGREPLPEPPAVTLRREMTDALRRYPDWEIVDEIVVDEALRRAAGELRPPTPDEARRIGTLIAVDAVMRGQVTEFEERVGTELAAKSPARVVFAVELVRIPQGMVVWQGEYAETQQALSDNLWNLFGFMRAPGG